MEVDKLITSKIKRVPHSFASLAILKESEFNELLAINRLECDALKCGFAVHRLEKPPNGCQCKIYTFNDFGEIENAFIYSYVDAFSQTEAGYKTYGPFIQSLTRESTHFNVTLKTSHIKQVNWITEAIPILFVLYDVKTNEHYFIYLQKYFETKEISSESNLSHSLINIQIPIQNALNKGEFRKIQHFKNKIFTNPKLSSISAIRKKRDISHVTSDRGVCFFEWKALASRCKIDRIPADADYGIDLNVYMYDNNFNLETGCVFIQIKSQLNPKYTSEHLVFNNVETSHIAHWMDLPYPLIFVVVDVLGCKAYWIHIQEYFKNKEKTLSEKYNTVYIPLKNALGKTAFDSFRFLIKNANP